MSSGVTVGLVSLTESPTVVFIASISPMSLAISSCVASNLSSSLKWEQWTLSTNHTLSTTHSPIGPC